MANKPYLTKDAKLVPEGRQLLEVKFRPASDLELKAIGDDLPEGYIAGWASTPDLDLYHHVVVAGAFDKSIRAKGLTGPKGIKLLVGHDRNKPAGAIKRLETRGDGLWIEAQLNLKISYVRDIYEAAKDNGGFSFSVGFYLEDYQFKTDTNDMEYLQINEGELEEVSLVVFPGNPEAVNTFIKGISGEEAFVDLPSFEKALVAAGLAKSRNDAQRLTRAVKKNLALFRDAEATEAPTLRAPVAKEKLDALGRMVADLKSVFE